MSLELRRNSTVTWLASYPRSGNTLLRIILKRCFGFTSQSIYSDTEFSDTLRDVVGHEPIGDDPARFLRLAQEQHRNLYVKTHELPPPDHHPVIYVVRDGRAAIVSYIHFLREILKRDVAPKDVIRGTVGVSWSRHVRAWALPPRPNSLIVRYEDLVMGESETLKKISAFIGAPQQRDLDISFKSLHALAPDFFRSGSNRRNIAELDTESEALFEQIHGTTLQAMGYEAARTGELEMAGPRISNSSSTAKKTEITDSGAN
jgi:hypothetical protein